MRVLIWVVLLMAVLSTGMLLAERDRKEPRIQPVPVQSDVPGEVVR